MKSKLLIFSILLITCVFSSCGLIKKEVDDPTTPTYYTLAISAGEGGKVNSNVNGKYMEGEEVKIIATANSGWQFRKWSDGDARATRTLIMNKNYTLTASFEKKSSEPTETIYYIKHPWGTGLDAAWTWQQMTKQGNYYVYEGLWGGKGANINTKASDSGADWFDVSEITGASSLYIGDGVKFTYVPNQKTLSVTKTSDGGNTAQVRFRKEDTYNYVTIMAIEQSTGNISGATEVVASYEFGTSAGTSSYYEINARESTPTYYYTEEGREGWYYYDDVRTYVFEKGKKYTYSCGDDGSYLVFTIYDDGTSKAPAEKQIVAQKRILKRDLMNANKIQAR